jgi:hypothetical protein
VIVAQPGGGARIFHTYNRLPGQACWAPAGTLVCSWLTDPARGHVRIASEADANWLRASAHWLQWVSQADGTDQ